MPVKRRVVDLSHPIEGSMPVFPSDPAPAVLPWSRIPVQPFNSEVLHLATHTGTHMDAPNHFFTGAAAIERVSLERCACPGAVLDLREAGTSGVIDANALRRAEGRRGRAVAEGEAVLLWTGWSGRWRSRDFLTHHPGLTEDGARYLAERRVAAVGVDSVNLDRPDAHDFPAHKELLGRGIPIVENLARLGAIRSSRFTFVALPLGIVGATGSPVRAVAIIQG
jgi:kynurenine formamidase